MLNDKEKQAISKLREIIEYDKKHRIETIYDKEQIEFRNNIELMLNLVENQSKEIEKLKHKNLKLIDLLHNEIVYYAMSNDGYFWDGTILIKCNEKYVLVEFKGSQSGWIKNQIECVDKEFISNAIGDRYLDKVDSRYLGKVDGSFPSYFNTFLESIYGYPISDEILNQLGTQDVILLEYNDIKKYLSEVN